MVTLEVVRAVRASSVAELSWLTGDGEPRVHGVVLLPGPDGPVVAFTYADADVARAVAAAPEVVATMAEARSTGAGFRPTVLRGTPSLTEDRTGETFRRDLLAHELRRYPPSRLLADSPLLCREHWWYLPRLLVRIDVVAMRPFPARSHPDDRLLAVADGGQVVVGTVRTEGERPGADRIPLRAEAPLPPGAAVLFGQDASFPDLEEWTRWSFEGDWDGTGLSVRRAPVAVGLEPRRSLRERVRQRRELERRCRANLR
jgi:hypothetical protein